MNKKVRQALEKKLAALDRAIEAGGRQVDAMAEFSVEQAGHTADLAEAMVQVEDLLGKLLAAVARIEKTSSDTQAMLGNFVRDHGADHSRLANRLHNLERPGPEIG